MMQALPLVALVLLGRARAQTNITMGDTVAVQGDGVTVEDNTIIVSSAGSFRFSGTLADGQIRVNAGGADEVVLELDGIDISSSTTAPLVVANAGHTTITLLEGTENRLTDPAIYTSFLEGEEDEPNGAIFSKDDLTIEGPGSLVVHANYHNGIQGKDGLVINGGVIVVTAMNDGIKGKDSLEIGPDSDITVVASSDGLQSSKGPVTIQPGAVLDITSGEDGIQAETQLNILGGDINVQSGGGSNETLSEDGTAKGLKAALDITIEDGVIVVDSADDAIHSDDAITINGGKFTLAAADDGIHADSSLTINGGNINITRSYEGIESALITINDGVIHLVASDDGINAAKANNSTDGGGGGPGGGNGRGCRGPGGPGRNATNARPGQGGGPGGRPQGGGPGGGGPPMGGGGPRGGGADDDVLLTINGGYIVVDAGDDGLDSNGHTNITGGTVLVNGPAVFNAGALDADGQLKVSGGFVLAVGFAGMAQSPSSNSTTQVSVRHIFQTTYPEGTMIHVEHATSGASLFTFAPAKEFQSMVFSSPEIVMGESYSVFVGGSVDGPCTDGLCQGRYNAEVDGELVATITIDSMVINESNGFDDRGGGVFEGERPPRPECEEAPEDEDDSGAQLPADATLSEPSATESQLNDSTLEEEAPQNEENSGAQLASDTAVSKLNTESQMNDSILEEEYSASGGRRTVFRVGTFLVGLVAAMFV